MRDVIAQSYEVLQKHPVPGYFVGVRHKSRFRPKKKPSESNLARRVG